MTVKTQRLDSRYKDVDTVAYLYDEDTAIITSTGQFVREILNDTPHIKVEASKDINHGLKAIDFEGGPMISIGDTIFDKKIKSIRLGYIVELE